MLKNTALNCTDTYVLFYYLSARFSQSSNTRITFSFNRIYLHKPHVDPLLKGSHALI